MRVKAHRDMEIDFSNREIILNKVLNDLDNLALDFIKILDENAVKYVLVSGYVAILFGRSRSSEDIDVIAEKISKAQFLILWHALSSRFRCIITNNPEEAYDRYLADRAPVRFSRGEPIAPNMEFTFPKLELEQWVLDNAIIVRLNGNMIKISQIELQIAYKLSMGTQKDIEDARHLYRLFKERLDESLLKLWLKKLHKEDMYDKYLYEAA